MVIPVARQVSCGHYIFMTFTQMKQCDSVSQVAVKALPFYREYFGVAYPLPKMDLVTIADFGVGAMENWGMVTYRSVETISVE